VGSVEQQVCEPRRLTMWSRAARRVVVPRRGYGRGAALAAAAAIAVATGRAGTGSRASAEAEGSGSAAGRWVWPSWLPSVPALSDTPIAPGLPDAAPAGGVAQKPHVPPSLSPGPQTSQPVFKDQTLEGLRLARIRQYEEDVRKLSSTEKIFVYFASSVDKDGVARMTPHDLLRATVRTPLARSSAAHLARLPRGGLAWHALSQPSFHPYPVYTAMQIGSYLTAEGQQLPGHAAEFFDAVDLDKDGFISWPEFLLLTTLLSISPMQLKMAFRMFDKDNNGVCSLAATQ
jgi:hypothetical protein